jgi:hypothetical protein
MKTRYADLRGRAVRVKGSLSASTYYNCRFGSQSRWRSFELSEGLFGGVHVYCNRGEDGCESIFQGLASGGFRDRCRDARIPQFELGLRRKPGLPDGLVAIAPLASRFRVALALERSLSLARVLLAARCTFLCQLVPNVFGRSSRSWRTSGCA